MDAKCRWRSNRLDGAVSFREPLGQTKVMKICQGETLNHQGAITHEVCCLFSSSIVIRTKSADSLKNTYLVHSKEYSRLNQTETGCSLWARLGLM